MPNDKTIFVITDKNEERFLRTRTADFDFTKTTERDRRQLADHMRAVMHAANGIGLSANQIGLPFRMFVAEVPQKNRGPKFYAVFNPAIVNASNDTEAMEEGCLSIPKTWGTVARAKEVTLTGFDKHERPMKVKAKGLLAKVFQHEMDHLDGILFIDKATDIHHNEDRKTDVA